MPKYLSWIAGEKEERHFLQVQKWTNQFPAHYDNAVIVTVSPQYPQHIQLVLQF